MMSKQENGEGDPSHHAGGAGRVRLGMDVRGYFYLVLMVVLGSTTAAAARLAVRELPIALLPVVRFGVAGLCVLPMIRGRGSLRKLLREDWPWLVVAAAMCVPVNQGFFLTAARLGPTSHVGIFYATAPLVVLLGAWTLRTEPPDLGRLWGVLASVLGISVVGVGNLGGGGGSAPGDARAVMAADALLVGAVISWGIYVIVSKPLVVRHGALPVLAGTFLLGSLLNLPIAIFSLSAGPAVAIGQVSATAWLALAFLALFVTPLGQACQNLALCRLDASQVANFSNASPLLTVVWGIWLFGEALTPALIIGGILTFCGISWTGRPRRRPRSGGIEGSPVQPEVGLRNDEALGQGGGVTRSRARAANAAAGIGLAAPAPGLRCDR
ncbi:MAG: DMT family transporter [Isosphaeraceae bacterium]